MKRVRGIALLVALIIVALATAIAGVVRARGYPFATASIGAQAMAGGVLRVTVQPGKIDAVRVIGAANAAADAILVGALTGGRPVTPPARAAGG